MNWLSTSSIVVFFGILYWLCKKGIHASVDQKEPQKKAALDPISDSPRIRDEGKPSSGDLAKWIAALTNTTDPLERHRLLQCILEFTYKNRKKEEHRESFRTYARMHAKELPGIMPALVSQIGDGVKKIATFKQLAIVLEEDGAFEEGIQVCREAIALGIEDGTKTRFQGRAARLQKKNKSKLF